MIGPDIGTLTTLGELNRSRLDPARLDAAQHVTSKEALRKVAVEFEASFLAEMLKHTGVGKPVESFGGGPGEAAFSGMLTQEYAEQLAERGGLGLADRIYAQLAHKAGV